MKTSPLPSTDLANFAALPSEEKWRRLQGYKQGVPPLAYKVTRRYYADLLKLPAGRLPIEPVDIEKLLAKIRAECRKKKDDIEAASNVLVARGIRHFAERFKVSGRTAIANELLPRLIAGRYVECWDRLFLEIDGRPVVPFFDLRRSGSKLTALGHQVAFSLMHENIRALDPDLADYRLAIVQLDDDKTCPPEDRTKEFRVARIRYADGLPLFNFEQLSRMVAETDRMWQAISEGREFDARMYGDEPKVSEETPPLVRMWRREA